MGSELVTDNSYLRDPTVRERLVFTSVASSSAVDGIHAPFKVLAEKRAAGKLSASMKPSRKKPGARTKYVR